MNEACCVVHICSLPLWLFTYVQNHFTFTGLSAEELDRLANLGIKSQKTARRDIAHVVSYI